MKKIRVLIVEDSPVVRELLRHIVDQDPRLEVAAAVGSAEEALKVIHGVSPDVVSMDIRLPGINGFEATQRIMSEKPTPIVVVSASVQSEDLKITMNALRAGALAVVEKPVGAAHSDYESMAGHLCTQLAIMSQVKVVRQRRQRQVAWQLGGEHRAARASSQRLFRKHKSPKASASAVGTFQALGMVASTGGPNAVVHVLNSLGPDFPLPIFLVQHITPSFAEGFVSWLNGACLLSVVLAQDGEIPQRGQVYVAPPDRHLNVENGCLRLGRGDPVSGQCPSGTVLLATLARTHGEHALAVVLTGMGDDGAQGLLEVRQAGGHTIAEDESTAVVYSMPAVAVQLGAACESLPLQAIGPRIVELVSGARKVQ